MWKDYKETFDGVHASQRLRTEVMNMKHEENVTKRRRVPAAALAAAILVIALAGTALAVEIINRVKVDLLNPDEAGVSTEGYFLDIKFSPIPLESLSAEALERFASGEADDIRRCDGVDADLVTWRFNSWAEADTFLGLDLGRNTVLEQYPEAKLSTFPLDSPPCGCLVGSTVLDEGKRPADIVLLSDYQIGDCSLSVTANLEVDTPAAEEFLGRSLGQWENFLHVGALEGRYTAEDEQYTSEEYVTPSGLTTTIVTRSGTQVGPAAGDSGRYDLQCSRAYFIMNRACYTISCKGADHEQEVALLKEILDAYE